MQFAARLQDRLEKFLHNLFRNTPKLEVRLFCYFPEFIQSACTGTFETFQLDDLR